jgi:hypothetical protein
MIDSSSSGVREFSDYSNIIQSTETSLIPMSNEKLLALLQVKMCSCIQFGKPKEKTK